MSVQQPIKLERVGALRVASIELTGPYEGWGRGLMELKRWLDTRGVRVIGGPIGLFYDSPTITPQERLRSEACLAIEDEVKPEGRFSVKVLPAAEMVSIRGYPRQEHYTKLYGPFLESVMRSGYRFDGPARETFAAPTTDLMPGMGIMVQQPVKRV